MRPSAEYDPLRVHSRHLGPCPSCFVSPENQPFRAHPIDGKVLRLLLLSKELLMPTMAQSEVHS